MDKKPQMAFNAFSFSSTSSSDTSQSFFATSASYVFGSLWIALQLSQYFPVTLATSGDEAR